MHDECQRMLELTGLPRYVNSGRQLVSLSCLLIQQHVACPPTVNRLTYPSVDG